MAAKKTNTKASKATKAKKVTRTPKKSEVKGHALVSNASTSVSAKKKSVSKSVS